jgi:membrane protein
VNDWLRHRCPRLGAALAYYAVFSLGPLLLIVTAVAGLFFGPDAVRGSLTAQFRGLLGESGGQAIDAMIEGAASASSGRTAAGIGIVLLLVAALAVVVQMKDALNTIWEVEDPLDAGWWWYVRTYLISFAGILSLGLLLAISLVVSTGLTAFGSWVGIPAGENLFWQAVNLALSLSVLSALFALLFKYFPDTAVAWADVWPGAIATAALFEAGKLAISLYIGMQGLESTYGAAASFVVLLIWVYYSSQIVLFGAELTHVYAQRRAARGGATLASVHVRPLRKDSKAPGR